MKRKRLPSSLKNTLLVVPAATLMLGAAQAGTTIGLNFQAWYYDSGATPQTVGFGDGYQTTGFPVTARAFGVAPANWFNTDPLDCQNAISTSVTFGGTLTAQLTAHNAWQSGIGEQVAGWNPETVVPGNDEVTWGYLDDGNTTGDAPSVSISGLASVFPHGYVLQTIAANSGVRNFDPVDFTDGTTTNTSTYSTYYIANPVNDGYSTGGTVGLSSGSGAFTSDSININPHPKTAPNRSVLAGFIVTDQPVVSLDPKDTSVNLGSGLTLTAGAVGLSNNFFYQWRLNGTTIPGANSATYSKASVATADAGNYDLVVTNLYGSTTSLVAAVTVIAVPSITTDLTGVSGTIYSGANFSKWSIVAAGGQPLFYEWLKNGSTPAGTVSPTLTLTNVTVADSGAYSVIVSNQFGTAHSATNTLTVVASPDLYTTDVAQDAPGAYWPLNETSGTNAFDYSGSGNTGNLNGGVTQGVAGPQPPDYLGFAAGKTAYQFDGSTSYINCGTGPSLSGNTDFTLEAWINTTAIAAGMIVQQRYAGGFNGEYMFEISGGQLSFTVYGGGGYQFSFATTEAVNDGLWHHVAAVRSGTNGFIYIDGAEAASATGPEAPLDPTFTTAIGRDQRDSVSYFSGTISDVAIYPVALSPHRIALHAYNGRLAKTPFSIKVVSGGYIIDSKPVGTPHPGINNNATWTNIVIDANLPPVARTGVEVFSGSSQIVTPASADFNTTNGTIMFWVQANAPITGSGAEGAMLFDRRTTNGAVIVLHDDGSIFWQGPSGAYETGYIPDNNWHHVAVTYGQTTSDSISIYIDGTLSAAFPVAAAWSWPPTQEIELGTSHDPYWQKLTGQMDDFRLYSRILTPTEIALVHASDALIDTSTLTVRYSFDTSGGGASLSWPVGTLESSPTLGPSAVWTPVPNAASPYPFLPPGPANPAGGSLFYRAGF